MRFSVIVLFIISVSANQLSEALHIRPLQDGKLSATFEFTTLLRDASPTSPLDLNAGEESRYYTLFPLALGQLLRQYAVSELHLSLTAGQWNYARWGNPDTPSVSSGAELWAWMGEGSPESAKKRWKDLTNGLAGLFCASLGSLDDRRTTSPTIAFRPEGHLPADTNHTLFYAPLASESVCTENLTPFLKLLPCKSRSGIAMLLNPHRLFDADWHGMGVHVTWLEDQGIQLRLTVGAVFDPVRLSGDVMKRDWTFRSVFGRTISKTCPVATNSQVTVKLPFADPYSITPEPTSVDFPSGLAIYDVSEVRGDMDLAMAWPDDKFQYPPSNAYRQPPIAVRRLLTGGQTEGSLSISLTNNGNRSREVLWLETMPWFINLYMHTLEVHVDGRKADTAVTGLSYTPPSDHQPTLLECTLEIPPFATLQLTLDLEKASIAYTEHPPDASRGWDLPPAVFTLLDDLDGQVGHRIYTTTLLGDLPTPDFSMPYNVIIMTSTVIALVFGSIFNMLTREFVWVKVE